MFQLPGSFCFLGCFIRTGFQPIQGCADTVGLDMDRRDRMTASPCRSDGQRILGVSGCRVGRQSGGPDDFKRNRFFQPLSTDQKAVVGSGILWIKIGKAIEDMLSRIQSPNQGFSFGPSQKLIQHGLGFLIKTRFFIRHIHTSSIHQTKAALGAAYLIFKPMS